MIALDVATFFMRLDENHEVFKKNVVTRNNRKFYEGNAKLNKFLQLSQNIFLAKYGKPLFEDDLYAYDNGAVIPSVLEKYSYIYQHGDKRPISNMTAETVDFLKKIFYAFKNATVDELILLSHEDIAWEEKSRYHKKQEQIMNTKKYIEQYKQQYADIIKVMDRMVVK